MAGDMNANCLCERLLGDIALANADLQSRVGGNSILRGRLWTHFAESWGFELLRSDHYTWKARGLESIIDYISVSSGISRVLYSFEILDSGTSNHCFLTFKMAAGYQSPRTEKYTHGVVSTQQGNRNKWCHKKNVKFTSIMINEYLSMSECHSEEYYSTSNFSNYIKSTIDNLVTFPHKKQKCNTCYRHQTDLVIHERKNLYRKDLRHLKKVGLPLSEYMLKKSKIKQSYINWQIQYRGSCMQQDGELMLKALRGYGCTNFWYLINDIERPQQDMVMNVIDEDVLLGHFSKLYTANKSLCCINISESQHWSLKATVEDITILINKSQNSGASGLNNLSNKLLKFDPVICAKILSILYANILENKIIPQSW
ncbi:uncharacterized protein [Ambystoma mexicanum]|uniref:uncharacterized protein n=1 Tax=Ambystoma mexicanum TaxID=8296 RepID=UPI0037E91ECC